jgi:hypothetical protein
MRSFRSRILPLAVAPTVVCAQEVLSSSLNRTIVLLGISRTPFCCYRDLIISSQAVPHFCFNSRTDNYLTLLMLILSHVVACGAIRKLQNKSLMYASRLGRYLTWPALSRFPLWDRGCKRNSFPLSARASFCSNL